MDKDLSPTSCDSPESSFEGRRFFNDDILSRLAEYGSTPTRTKISRRERKQMTDEQINSSGATKSPPRVIHAQAARRNTLNSVYFAELLEKSDPSESLQNQAGWCSSLGPIRLAEAVASPYHPAVPPKIPGDLSGFEAVTSPCHPAVPPKIPGDLSGFLPDLFFAGLDGGDPQPLVDRFYNEETTLGISSNHRAMSKKN